MDMIKLFVGHDPREAVAFDVFKGSVIDSASSPVSITSLASSALRGYYVEGRDDGSNAFTYLRFLVPALCNFDGWAIFADGDMLCRADIAELWALRDPHTAVQVVKHEYKTKHPVKYLGAKNEDYPRKNWSSVILWNCAHPANRCLTPEYVKTCPGPSLHRFAWLPDQLVGELPQGWNWLVGEYRYNHYARLVHFTLGAPCFAGYDACDYASEWYAQLKKQLDVPQASEVYRNMTTP